jgi:coenzyme F420-reducing hydrogenase beta subunit
MELDAFGRFQAVLDPGPDDAAAAVLEVCPFAEEGPDEDALALSRFPEAEPHPEIGRRVSTYAGHVVADGYRERGSSGGITSWFLAELLGRQLVDGVIHVKPGSELASAPLFAFGLSASVEELVAGAKSRYYPIELSGAFELIRERPGRYAVVGIPCFIKAVQRLRRVDPVIDDRVATTVALVCGHLKSTAFAEYIAWQLDVPPDRLETIDFRHKLPGRPANRYGARVVGRIAGSGEDRTVVRAMEHIDGGDWGRGYFKYKACDYCDDVLGETADISFGDAWLPEYNADSAGTNVVTVRRAELDRLLRDGRRDGSLALDDISADRVAASQRSGLRHRRDGLAYRLDRTDRSGDWRPPKRVRPASRHLTRKERRLFAVRVRLARDSHHAFRRAREAGDLRLFERMMRPTVRAYDGVYGRRPWQRTVRRARSLPRRIARRAARLAGLR